MKQQAKIDKWAIAYMPFYGGYVLTGHVKDHPRQSDMVTDTQVTSPLLSIDLVNKRAETQNTVYELLEQE